MCEYLLVHDPGSAAGLVLRLMTRLNQSASPRLRSLLQRWKQAGLSELGLAISTKLAMVRAITARIDKQLKEASEAKTIDKAKKLLGLLKTDELGLEEAMVALERAGVSLETKTAPALTKAQQAAKKLKEEIAALQDEFSGGKLQAEMDKLGVALEPLISKGEISGVQMEKLGKRMDRFEEVGCLKHNGASWELGVAEGIRLQMQRQGDEFNHERTQLWKKFCEQQRGEVSDG